MRRFTDPLEPNYSSLQSILMSGKHMASVVVSPFKKQKYFKHKMYEGHQELSLRQTSIPAQK